MGKIPGNASFPIWIAIPVMEIIIYLVFEENGYTPKNGVFNRPFFSLSLLGNCSGSLKLIGALACKLQNEPKNDPLSAILMEKIEIIGPPLFANFFYFSSIFSYNYAIISKSSLFNLFLVLNRKYAPHQGLLAKKISANHLQY